MTLTPEQHSELQHGLGGSEALTYCGQDPRKSLVDLYREKVGEVRPTSLARDPVIDQRRDWGHRLEPVMREWLAEELGREVVPAPPTQRNPDLPFMIGHLDGILAGGPPREGVEIKTCDKFLSQEFGDVGTDQVPIRHVLQVTHYMVITGIRRFHLGALIGGNDARHYVIDYDLDLAQLLVQRAREFWAHVETRTPPDPVTLADVDYHWPHSTEIVVKANDSVAAAVRELDRLRHEERKAALTADELEVAIKTFMGGAAVLADAKGRRLVTWRQQNREHFDARAFARDHPDLAQQYRAASSFRVFRLK